MDQTAKNTLSCLVIDNDADEANRIALHIATIKGAEIKSKLAIGFDDGLVALRTGEHTICLIDNDIVLQHGMAPLHALSDAGIRTPLILVGHTDHHLLDDKAIPPGIIDIVGREDMTPALLARIFRYAIKTAGTPGGQVTRQPRVAEVTETLRTQANLMKKAFDNATHGIAMFDRHGVLSTCNSQYLKIYGFSSDVVKPGISIKDILKYSASLGNYSEEEARRIMAVRVVQMDASKTSSYEQHLLDGRSIAVIHQPMADGGSMTICEDVTEMPEQARELSA